MVFIESPRTDPYFNLALEEYLFERLDKTKRYFLLWQNQNAVVVGKFQNTEEEINRPFIEEHGIAVVRRLSGGGAVYHDLGNLNFTFIVDAEDTPDFNFSVFVKPVVDLLKELGADAAFSGRNDITIAGKKISGNSQYIRNRRLLHHGCILLDSNLKMISGALNVKPDKFISKSVKSVRSRVTCINAELKEPISMETFKQLLKDRIFASEELEQLELTPKDIEEVEQLRDTRYASWEWNYGRSPEYQVRKDARLSCGLVTALLRVERGRIRSVHLYGDFFGSEKLPELEERLCGLPLDSSLLDALKELDIGSYIYGATPLEFYQLLMG